MKTRGGKGLALQFVDAYAVAEQSGQGSERIRRAVQRRQAQRTRRRERRHA